MILPQSALIFLIFISSGRCIDPLGKIYSTVKFQTEHGCDVNQLPDSVIWCNGNLNSDKRLPDNTWCQSHDPHVPNLVCRGGRWNTRWNINFDEDAGRYRRDVDRAVANTTDRTCLFLCVDDQTGSTGFSPPGYSYCPASVTLHPTGGSLSVTHTWTTPIAIDTDGTISSLEHIVGPTSPATFVSSPSPGSHQTVTYMATDNDNLKWPCDFKITAEVPNCPPIVHIENGNITCSDEINQDSVCVIQCIHGYFVNGTMDMVCQDNGTWSFGEDVPHCIPAECGDTLDTGNFTDIELVCENDTLIYDTVCWLQCLYNYTLRNEDELTRILEELQNNIDDAIAARQQAEDEAADARGLADNLELVAEAALLDYILAFNHTESVKDQLDAAIGDLANLQVQMDQTQTDLTTAEDEAQNASLSNQPNVGELNAIVDNITAILNQIIIDVNYTAVNVETINQTYLIALNNEELAKNRSDEAQSNYTQADILATELMLTIDTANDSVSAAMLAYVNANEYSGLADVEIPTYARCQADGTWAVEGNPYCIDIHPPTLSCVPLHTEYLTGTQTSSSVNWTLPVVIDNSPNITVVRLSGPEPGDVLELGQHVANYMAVDPSGSIVYCDTYINVEVRSCGILDDNYDNSNLTYSCDSFNQGATCNLSCINYQAVTQPGTASCDIDSSVTPPTVSWSLHDGTCEEEACPIPPTPTHGVLNCPGEVYTSNSSLNVTNSTLTADCVLSCDTGYMPPYRMATLYACNQDGTWSPLEFPSECIPAGNAQYATYTFVLSSILEDMCSNIDQDALVSDVQSQLQGILGDYPACSEGYICSLVVTPRMCVDNEETSSLEMDLAILVTCDGAAVGAPWEAACDLSQDLMPSISTSLGESISQDNLLGSTPLTNVVVAVNMSDIPVCASGVLVGHYCARCPKGTFYNDATDQCQACGVKSYQNSYHSNACVTCTAGTSTGITGATSAQDCLAWCPAGSYSYTSVVPCASCPLGTYQYISGSTDCTQCPEGTWTTIAGSSSVADCVEFDVYFDLDQTDFALTNATDQMTVVFWMRNDQSPMVSVGVYYDTTDFAFVFEAGGTNSQLLFKSVENIPTDVAIETYEWNLIGVVWDCPLVTIYKNGLEAFNFDIQDDCDQSKLLVMSANTGTLLSGLSIVQSISDATDMAWLYEDCSHRLTTPTFSMANLAALGRSTIKFVPTNCSVSNDTLAVDDVCAVHLCENGGSCVVNNITGYTCNCTEEYGGPFCEEFLVHGNWSGWYNGSSCSRTCDTGVQLQYRYCNNPHKSFYGNDCEGNSTEWVDCFMAACSECPSLDSDTGAFCDLMDEQCTPECPPGYVLPAGQQAQTYQCGVSTNSEWVPLQRLPVCAASLQPEGYTIDMTFTFSDPVPCSEVNSITAEFNTVIQSLRCIQNGSCSGSVSIENCGVDPSHLVLTLTSALTSNVPFDLPGYYNNLQMTESISEAVFAIYMLELTVQDLLDNPSVLSVSVGSLVYSVLNSTDSISIQARTNCAAGQVNTQGVCAMCQRGTYKLGTSCVYCPRGSYTAFEAQTSCIPCPDRHTTLYIGSMSYNECYESVPPPDELPILIIVLSVVFGVLGITVLIITTLMVRRFYMGLKEREKFDMEADRNSLYTDFPDIAYNVFFKRRMVLGFDESGLPIISKVPVANGDVCHGEPDDESIDDTDFPEELPMPTKGSEPFAYPTEYGEPPFDYDPYSLWPEESVPPPIIPDPDFDFPTLRMAIRYRMPGRSHLDQAYPLQMFGYQDKIRGRTRKLLPFPVAIPIPKKLPKLMYRPPKPVSLMQQLKERFGINTSKDRDEMRTPLLRDMDDDYVPPLSLSTKSVKSQQRPKSKTSVDRWSVKPKLKLTERFKSSRMYMRSTFDRISPRSPKASPRFAKSAMGMNRSPLSIDSLTPRFARSAGAGPRTIAEDMPHPKPSRFVVPSNTRPSRSVMAKLPLRSMLKSAEPTPREPRPSTSLTMTGRKSVTIREGDTITRPTTAFTGSRLLDRRSSIRSTRDIHLTPYHYRPWSSRHSSVGGEDANLFDLDWVSSEYGGTSRPSTSASRPFTSMSRSTKNRLRPKTPSVHPAPNIHGNVKVVSRTPDFNLLMPKTKLKFGAPPEDHRAKFMAPPPIFKNKVIPSEHLPEMSVKHVWQDDEDLVDYGEDENEAGTFFMTEVPEVRKNEGQGQKKTSPPPPYSEVNQMTETSSTES